MNVIFFGIKEVEFPIFEKVKEKYKDLKLTAVTEVISKEHIHLVDGMDCVVVRENDVVNREILELLKAKGINYVFTRTAGFDHMDLAAGHELGIKMARVPSYSPTAIAELAFSYAHQLSRRSLHFGYKAHKKDFTVDDFGFAKELRSSTVLIMGTGKIGYESAKMFKSFGAKVLGYDLMPNKALTDVIEYVSLDEGLKQADIVTLHMPYIKGQNDKLVNAELLSKMKDGAILVNTSRSQIQDEKAILDAVKSGKLAGAAIDVFNNEKAYLFKTFDKIEDPVIAELLDLWPRVIVSPHIGWYTQEAATNMLEISLDNLKEYLETGDCKNKL